ncbi:MAG: Cof-type HAD-IIB family hydrolase [Ethanoligenens sp.]
MEYKVLALDIDGTVTNSEKQITENTKNTILQAQKQGIKVVLASGRPVHGVAPLAHELELDRYEGYILAFNGGKIIDCKTQKTIFEQVIQPEWVSKLYDAAKENNVHILSYTEDGNTVITEHPDDIYVQLECRINNMPLRQVSSFKESVRYPVNKCIMTDEDKVLAKVEPRVKEFVNGQLNVFRSEPFFLEVMPNHVDKAFALQKLLETLGYTNKNLIACGDGYNDVSMLDFAGLGVAMENAQDTAKKVSNFITRSNDEDGVAYAIDKFILETVR